ncbi:MAG: hypothetical protein RL695_1716, partial [Pseudomonadota bacterium]
MVQPKSALLLDPRLRGDIRNGACGLP